jgi:hypothetical protein
VLNQAKGKATPATAVRLLPGLVTDPSITKHFQFIPDADVACPRPGHERRSRDMRVPSKRPRRKAARLGGHSLGGSITTAMPRGTSTGSRAHDLSARTRRRQNPTPSSPDQANLQLQALRNGSPWLTFGGIPAPYAGLFNATGSTGVKIAPDNPSLGYAWPALPANLKPPVAPTNEGQYGYALDVKTSPMGLRAAQAHLGQLEESGDLALGRHRRFTPITRHAEMFWDGVSRAATAPRYHRTA